MLQRFKGGVRFLDDAYYQRRLIMSQIKLSCQRVERTLILPPTGTAGAAAGADTDIARG